MTNISILLQEAKPLYVARKRRRQFIKTAGFFCVCFVAAHLGMALMTKTSQPDEMISLYVSLYEPVNFNTDTFYGNVNWENDIPLDEYGLIAVA